MHIQKALFCVDPVKLCLLRRQLNRCSFVSKLKMCINFTENCSSICIKDYNFVYSTQCYLGKVKTKWKFDCASGVILRMTPFVGFR